MKAFLDKCICISMMVLVGEGIRRLSCATTEYFLYWRHYAPANRGIQILNRCLSVNRKTFIVLILMSSATSARIAVNTGFLKLIKCYAPVIIIYWIAHKIGCHKSPLDYALFIRENNGLNVADAMAAKYFHEYLIYVISQDHNYSGIRDRIKDYANIHHVEFALDRLIILLPDSFYIQSRIESSILERAAPLETVERYIGGVKRIFTNDVYRFTVPINGVYYYLAVEGAAPALSYSKSIAYYLTSRWQSREMQREVYLKFYRTLRKLLSNWPEAAHQAELVTYVGNINFWHHFLTNDSVIFPYFMLAKSTNGTHLDIGYQLLEYVQSKLI